MKKLRSQTRRAARLGASGSERSPPCCAVCAKTITGEVREAPLGKGDAIVKICVACDEEPPRMGNYSFGAEAGSSSHERMAVRKGRVA